MVALVGSVGDIKVDGFPLKYIRRDTGDPSWVIGSSDCYFEAFLRKLINYFKMTLTIS